MTNIHNIKTNSILTKIKLKIHCLRSPTSLSEDDRGRTNIIVRRGSITIIIIILNVLSTW